MQSIIVLDATHFSCQMLRTMFINLWIMSNLMMVVEQHLELHRIQRCLSDHRITAIQILHRITKIITAKQPIYNGPTQTVGFWSARRNHLAWSESRPFSMEDHHTSFHQTSSLLYQSQRRDSDEIGTNITRSPPIRLFSRISYKIN